MNNYLTSVDNNAPMVFVTTYSLYNQGKQFFNEKSGFWINCDDFESYHDEIVEGFNSVDPDCLDDHEFMFTDFENFPDQFYCESGINFDMVNNWYNLNDDQREIVDLLLSEGIVCDIDDAIEKSEDCYFFEGNLSDYAYENCGIEIPAELQGYIDFEAMGEDWYRNGNDIIKVDYERLLILNF